MYEKPIQDYRNGYTVMTINRHTSCEKRARIYDCGEMRGYVVLYNGAVIFETYNYIEAQRFAVAYMRKAQLLEDLERYGKVGVF